MNDKLPSMRNIPVMKEPTTAPKYAGVEPGGFLERLFDRAKDALTPNEHAEWVGDIMAEILAKETKRQNIPKHDVQPRVQRTSDVSPNYAQAASWQQRAASDSVESKQLQKQSAGHSASYPLQAGLLVGEVVGDLKSDIDRGKKIADEELRHAISTSIKTGTSPHNTEIDALRHARWQSRMAKEIGPNFTAAVGLQHELKGLLEGQPLDELWMDMNNNREGRQATIEGRSIDRRKLINSTSPAVGPDGKARSPREQYEKNRNN